MANQIDSELARILDIQRQMRPLLELEKQMRPLLELEKQMRPLLELEKQMRPVLDAIELQEKVSLPTRYAEYFFTKIERHFSDIRIKSFRRLQDISFENLSRINLFAGINNSGKTTILEAVNLLTFLTNKREFIDLIRRRAKLPALKKEKIEWFVDQCPNAHIYANFNSEKIEVSSGFSLDTEDKEDHVRTVNFNAVVGDISWGAKIQFLTHFAQITGTEKSLCPCVFSSPFSGLDEELLTECHEESLKAGSKQAIIKFIQEYIDPDIENIEINKWGRFTVIHKNTPQNLDITNFGEGLQRVFQLGLLFAGAANGIVLIDEFDNALHAALLPDFVKLIYDLAIKFNVQVFLSSHSKECIDAFIRSDSISHEKISAYTLVEKDTRISARYFSGDRLSKLLESIDFDIRGSGKK